MVSRGQVSASMDRYKNSMLGNSSQQMAVCRIDKVNNDMTVDVTVMSGTSGTKVIHRVRLTSPYRNNDNGIIIAPEVGSLAIVVIISDVYQFIISYLNYSDANIEEIKELKDGEYILKSKKGSYIKFNDNQGVDIHSGGNSAIFIDNDSLLEVSETKSSVSVACESTHGVINDVVQGVERWYDKDVESNFTDKELVESMASIGESYIQLNERKPIIEIQKGNVVDNGKPVNLSLFENPADNPAACYKLEVDSNKGKFKILIGKDGSLELEGNIVKIKCNDLDLTESNNIGYSTLNFIER